jgi:hypothetical protein
MLIMLNDDLNLELPDEEEEDSFFEVEEEEDEEDMSGATEGDR